ncbi:MAG: hypothetical protein JSR82_23720 [Verrucomicrobia bacterium]|nr:hypothetical protein [Verrucomicrobiota bacterium]
MSTKKPTDPGPFIEDDSEPDDKYQARWKAWLAQIRLLQAWELKHEPRNRRRREKYAAAPCTPEQAATAAQRLGRLGGLKAARSMTPEARLARAQKASAAAKAKRDAERPAKLAARLAAEKEAKRAAAAQRRRDVWNWKAQMRRINAENPKS